MVKARRKFTPKFEREAVALLESTAAAASWRSLGPVYYYRAAPNQLSIRLRESSSDIPLSIDRSTARNVLSPGRDVRSFSTNSDVR